MTLSKDESGFDASLDMVEVDIQSKVNAWAANRQGITMTGSHAEVIGEMELDRFSGADMYIIEIR